MRTRLASFLKIALTLTVAGGAGCRQDGDEHDNQTKSLDNLAAGDTATVNKCEGSNKVIVPAGHIVVKSSDPDGELRKAVEEYLSALPGSVQQLFNDAGGRILIVDDARKICEAARLHDESILQANEDPDGFDSCFVYLSDPTGEVERHVLAVVHAPNAKLIQHAGVRTFGFMLSQYFSRLNPSDDVSTVTLADAETPVYRETKIWLADAFVKDVARQKIMTREMLSRIFAFQFDQETYEAIQTNLTAGKYAFRDLTFGFKKRKDIEDVVVRGADVIAGEAFDSLHCSAQSLQNAQEPFKLTLEKFKPIDHDFIEIAEQLTGAMAGAGADKPKPAHTARPMHLTADADDAGPEAAGFALGTDPLAALGSIIPLISKLGSLASMIPRAQPVPQALPQQLQQQQLQQSQLGGLTGALGNRIGQNNYTTGGIGAAASRQGVQPTQFGGAGGFQQCGCTGAQATGIAGRQPGTGQYTQPQYGNAGQYTQSQYGNAGQYTQSQYSNAGQYTQSQYGGAGQYTTPQYGAGAAAPTYSGGQIGAAPGVPAFAGSGLGAGGFEEF
jgi:hypothetical protein